MKWFIDRLYLVSFLVVAAQVHESAAQSTVLRWEIEATVGEVYDPDGIFPDVQLGDPIRGFISYDLATPPFDDDPSVALYFQDVNFAVAGMVIENPRDGTAIMFPPDPDNPLGSFFTSVGIANDIDDGLGPRDNFAAFQSVAAPDGFSGLTPMISVLLDGPPGLLADVSLPDSLNLADWSLAAISFADLLDLESGLEEPTSSYVIAEIHALRLVPEPATALLVSLAAVMLLNRRVH